MQTISFIATKTHFKEVRTEELSTIIMPLVWLKMQIQKRYDKEHGRTDLMLLEVLKDAERSGREVKIKDIAFPQLEVLAMEMLHKGIGKVHCHKCKKTFPAKSIKQEITEHYPEESPATIVGDEADTSSTNSSELHKYREYLCPSKHLLLWYRMEGDAVEKDSK